MKKVLSLLLVMIFILMLGIPIAADELEEAKSEKQRIDSMIKNTEKQMKSIQERIKQQKDQMNQAQQEEQQLKQQIQLKEEEIRQLEEQIRQLDDAILAARKDYFQKQELLKTRLKVIYQNSNRSIFEVFLESKNITDFFKRIQLMQFIASKDTELLEAIETARKDLVSKLEMRAQEKEAVEQQVALLNTEKQKVAEKISRSSQAIRDYSNELKVLERQIDKLEAESARLAKSIQALMEKNRKYAGGAMAWPSKTCTTISSGYGMRYHPILKKNKMHTGIDIPAQAGTDILAANDGKVIVASWQTGYGNTVIIDHGGGIATLYGHCSKILVKEGQTVKRGEVIAKVGSTGWSTGPHLHFEVIKDGKTVDPMTYFK